MLRFRSGLPNVLTLTIAASESGAARRKPRLPVHEPVRRASFIADLATPERTVMRSSRLTSRQQAHLVKLYRADEHSVTELAELFSVARATVCRAIDRAYDGVRSQTVTPARDDRRIVRLAVGTGRVISEPNVSVEGPSDRSRV
jgi:hypothetical protein